MHFMNRYNQKRLGDTSVYANIHHSWMVKDTQHPVWVFQLTNEKLFLVSNTLSIGLIQALLNIKKCEDQFKEKNQSKKRIQLWAEHHQETSSQKKKKN